MQLSKLHFHSLGIVAVNKPLDSHDIEVTPIEDLPMVDGELSDNLQEFSAKGKAPDGSSYETSADTSVTIKATWYPIHTSNRVTSPDVRRGEPVVIYRFGDTDKYYWVTQQYDLSLRKLETVIFVLSNTQDEDKAATFENSYFFEWSTHSKRMRIHTSKSDGEPFAYDIELNAKDGFLQIQDDIGNIISLDSAKVRMELINSDGSHIDMDRKVISVYAPDTINLTADNNINLKAGKSINSKAGTSINDDTGKITTKASETTNTVPLTKFTGNVQTAGATTTVGLSSTGGGTFGGGNFTINGNPTVNGVMTVTQLISVNAIVAPNIP